MCKHRVQSFLNYIFSFFYRSKEASKQQRETEPEFQLADFIPFCKSGENDKVNSILNLFVVSQESLEEGLKEAVIASHFPVIDLLIRKGAKNLDENLKYACEAGKYSLAELLVQRGARTVVGLRCAKSPNIIRMLRRVEQNSELIK